jgi:hypothetical protein
MIEDFHIDPGLRIMASRTAHRLSAGAYFRHAGLELSLVRILVASSTTPVFKIERQYFIRASSCAFFVAPNARYDCVSAIQWKTRILMHGDGEFGTMKIIHGVAGIALILVRSLCELAVVRIFVAVRALCKLYFEPGIGPGRDVALVA